MNGTKTGFEQRGSTVALCGEVSLVQGTSVMGPPPPPALPQAEVISLILCRVSAWEAVTAV